MRTMGRQHHRVGCAADHPVVQFSMTTQEATQCMPYSWSAFRPCTMATRLWGRHRGPMALMSTNPIGYNLQLMEGSVGSETDSSGALLYNFTQQVIDILHVGPGVHSHFIPSWYILLLSTPTMSFTSFQVSRIMVSSRRSRVPLPEIETTSAVQMASRASPILPSTFVFLSRTRPRPAVLVDHPSASMCLSLVTKGIKMFVGYDDSFDTEL